MPYEFNFGALGSVPPTRAGKGSGVFRLAVLGDFSARANRGEVEIGDALAARKPLRVDVDNLEDVLGRMGIELQLDLDGEEDTVTVEIGDMDALHPDELYGNLEIFSHLSSLRQRLSNSSTFAKAAKEVMSWPEVNVPKKRRRRKPKPRGAVVAANCRLSDFAALMDRDAPERDETPVDQLLKDMVAPHVVPDADPRQDVLIAAVDTAVSEVMRRVLHHPDFQATEALWRSVDMLTRQLETGANLKIVLYDITAEEVAADLSATENLEETGLYKLLVEQPALDAQQGGLSALVSNYQFEQTPPHAELLGRIAKIAAAADAPFLAAVSTECLKQVDPDDVNPLVRESWSALRELPEASYLALTVPRFMLRNPYGKRTDPVDYFDFEEFTPQYGLNGMLWGNGSFLVGLLLARTFSKQGFQKMNLGSIMSVGEMPFYYYTDADGDQVALPCTERLLTEKLAAHVTGQGFLPILSIRGRPEVRLGSFQSLAKKLLAGPWSDAKPEPVSPAKAAASAASGADESVDEDDLGAGEESSDSGDEDLDALLAGLGDDDTSDSDSGADDSGDDDLDALLAGLGGDDDDSSGDDSGDDDMDPDLAALLADL
jgi:type VI secretion system protein ImpC